MIYAPGNWYEESMRAKLPLLTYPQARLLTHESTPSPASPHFDAILTLTELHHLYDGPPLHAIMQAVCNVTGVNHVDLISPCRTRRYAKARFVYYYLARKLTPRSFPEIARRCGGKDHTTAMHGFHQVELHPELYAETISAVRKALGVGE